MTNYSVISVSALRAWRWPFNLVVTSAKIVQLIYLADELRLGELIEPAALHDALIQLDRSRSQTFMKSISLIE